VKNGRQLFEKEMPKKIDSLKKIKKVKMKPIVRKTPASKKKKKMSLRSEATKWKDEGRQRDEKDLTDLKEKDHRRQCSTPSSKIIGKNMRKMFENWKDNVRDNSTVLEGASPTPANGLFVGQKQLELGLLTRPVLERCDWSTPGHYNFTRPSQALGGGGGGLQHRPGGGVRKGD
jgi:hypothetical protein